VTVTIITNARFCLRDWRTSLSDSVFNVPLSVISANVKLALRCRSTLSENTKVLRARSGSPEKKSVSPRYHRVRNEAETLGVLCAYVFKIL
jgi:hypothetical protein